MTQRPFSCPSCGEWIGEPVKICPFCGRDLKWDPALVKEFNAAKKGPDIIGGSEGKGKLIDRFKGFFGSKKKKEKENNSN